MISLDDARARVETVLDSGERIADTEVDLETTSPVTSSAPESLPS